MAARSADDEPKPPRRKEKEEGRGAFAMVAKAIMRRMPARPRGVLRQQRSGGGRRNFLLANIKALASMAEEIRRAIESALGTGPTVEDIERRQREADHRRAASEASEQLEQSIARRDEQRRLGEDAAQTGSGCTAAQFAALAFGNAAKIGRAPVHWLADFLIEPEELDDDAQLDPRCRDDDHDSSATNDYAGEIEASGPSLDCG